MKILQVGKFFPIRGGVEKVMYDMMLGLSIKGIHCDMLCASTESHPSGTIAINQYARLLIMPTMLKLAATMIAPVMLTTLRKIAKQYDVIHIHHPDPMACLALFYSGYKGKVVLHWHSDILKQKNLLKVYSPLQDWLIRRAHIIVGTTPVYVKESPFLQNVQHKIDFIPIGVEPIRADLVGVNMIKKRYAGKRIVFSVGRLVEYKGYEYLVKAAKQLGSEVQIVIGGTGPLQAKLRALIDRLQVQDRVELIGFVADHDLPNYFAASDVFCLSSILKTEAFAIVQIEAMSCGKPIVSTHIPGSGVSWVNGEMQSGIVVQTADANGLADAIVKLLSNRQLYRSLAKGSRERYLTHFTRDMMVNKCMQVYGQLGLNIC